MRLKLNNKGSSIISVLIAMLLISALGATLLFTTYLGYQIKVAERSAKQNFYDAETAVNEIRDGIQEMVTESIAKAYTQVLVQYNNPDPEEGGDDDTKDKFKTFFRSALYSWKNGENNPLFTSPAGTSYDPDILLSFVRESEQTLTTITGIGTAAEDPAAGGVVLRGIKVRHVRGGFETTITTDIVIALPEFEYSVAEYALTGIPEFALIAKTALTQHTSGEARLTLTGNAYAGEINLVGAGNTLIMDGGTMICGENLEISGSGFAENARLVMSGSSLWANRIVINDSSSMVMNNKGSILSEAYVADDLELAGDGARFEAVAVDDPGGGASAAHAGRYYGFGYFTNASLFTDRIDYTVNSDIPKNSSAILINGHNTRLNLSGLSTLMLAGHSFISPGATKMAGTDILMGQSVSAKSDQLAYLLPASCLSAKSNPYIYQGDVLNNAVVNGVLWEDGDDEVTLNDYVGSKATVKTITYPLGSSDTHIAYYFLQFKTKEYANDYFREYFEHKPEKIQQYLRIYSDVLASSNSTQSSGNTYDLEAGDLNLINASGDGGASAIGVSASRLARMYQNYRVTLTSTISAADITAKDPYEYLVNGSAVGALTEDETDFRDDEGRITAVIVKNNDTGDSAYSVNSALRKSADICVILATGDVVVDAPFEGLIISGGTITMSESMVAGARLVTGALRASAEIGGKNVPLYHFLGANVDDSGDTGGENKSTWAVDTLVSYANWKKD